MADIVTIDHARQLAYQVNQKQLDWNKIERLGKKSSLGQRIQYKLGYTQPRLINTIQAINKSFAYLEQKGVKVFDPNIEDPDYKQTAKEYRSRFHPYFEIAQGITTEVKHFKKVSAKLKQEYHALECNLVGLRYRLGVANGGIDPKSEPLAADVAQLRMLALQWKKKQKLAINKDLLNDLEIKQLAEAAKYIEWLPLLVKKENEEFRKEFFNWALRDYNPVNVFVLCQNTQKQIKKALASCILGRIRRPNQEVLTFEQVKTKTDHVAKKILTLPVYHGHFDRFEADKQERINILKPTQEVTFKTGNYTLTVQEMWNEMGRKNERETNINFSAFGLINFHPVKGYWDAEKQTYIKPSMTKENWTQYVPPAEIVDHAELVSKYGHKVEGRRMFYKAAATRSTPDLSGVGCHGFWQLYIYMGNEKWRVLDIGLFAYRFQKNIFDGLMLFCATVKRVLCLMDQNGSYTHRQHAYLAQFPNEQQGQQLLDRLFAFMEKEGVFQFSAKNCSRPVQRVSEKVMGKQLPNLFRMRLSGSRAGFLPLDKVLTLLDKCPEWIRGWGMALLHFIFGSYRSLDIMKNGKKVRYSVLNYYGKEYRLQKTHELYNPAFLHHQIIQDKRLGKGSFIDGELTWGQTDKFFP